MLLRLEPLDPPPDPEALARALAELAIDPRARAERLEPEQHLALARALDPSLRRA